MVELVKYDNDQRKKLIKNLEFLRNERGLTKKELATKLGWSYKTVTSWFRGERLPTQFGLETICDFFNISDVDLLGSPMHIRTFFYYRRDKLIASGTFREIADQTGLKMNSLYRLLSQTHKNGEKGTYIIELEDDTRYTIDFKQTFTMEELEKLGLSWLVNSPMVEVKEVEG